MRQREIKLKALLENCDFISKSGPLEIEIQGITSDSRSVGAGDLFVAIKGSECDGHSFAAEAIANGARAVVLERDLPVKKGVAKILVRDSRLASSRLAARFYGYPSSKIKTVGITGTNGKTTVSYLVDKVFSEIGLRCGIIGTVCYKIKDRVIAAQTTTPGPIDLHRILNEMVAEGCDHAIIEVSSHSLDQHRVDEVSFDVAVFTNLTQDHLDYHSTMNRYFDAKAKLFEHLNSNALAVLNIDDPYGEKLIRLSGAKVMTYGMDNACDVTGRIKGSSLEATEFVIRAFGAEVGLTARLIGRHNLYNVLAATCVGLAQGVRLDQLARALEGFEGVPGRLERIRCGQPFEIFVDYAHTDNAMACVLSTLRTLTSRRIISVFGCGGDRDPSKRPLMGKVAQRYSDYVILTSDNPRGEDPMEIVSQIESGMDGVRKDYKVILDRYRAIQEALQIAEPQDVVVICGKGHEQFQILRDKRVPFDDRQAVRECLRLKRS